MTTAHTPSHLRGILRRHGNAEAARLLGISRERARQLRAQLQIPVPARGDERRRLVIRALARGLSAAKVAEEVGLSVSQVRRIGRAEGVTRRPRPARCGTRAGYVAHLRAGEPACAECLEANRAATAENRQPKAEVPTVEPA